MGAARCPCPSDRRGTRRAVIPAVRPPDPAPAQDRRASEASMTIPLWIHFAAVLVALVSLIWQQRRVERESARKEKRIETKLRIFYALSRTERALDEGAIIAALEQGRPLKDADRVEVRKALYEMLSEETIRFTTGKKYRPRDRPATPR